MSKSKVHKSQEGSDYWRYVMSGPGFSQNGQIKEALDANPDQLSEDDSFIKKSPLSDEDEENLAAYYKAIDAGVLKKLAPRQREIWKLKFFKWLSEEDIAAKLGISLSAVRTHLRRGGAKIKAEIIKRQNRKAMLDGNYFNDGFKKGLDAKGEAKTDREFGDRLEKHKDEIDDFCKRHPELERGL